MANEVTIIDKSEIDGFRSDGSSAVDHAKNLARAIVDAPTLEAAAIFMLAAKDKIKRVTERFKQPKADARKSWQDWLDLENELCEPYQRIEKEIIKPAMARYQAEEDQRIRAEEDKQRAEAKKREEDERLRRAEALSKDGEQAQAEAILDAPVVVPPVVVPRAEAPAGISYRDVWKFEVIDPALVPRQYLAIDEKAIGGVVRALKAETRIPGVRVWSEKTVAGRV